MGEVAGQDILPVEWAVSDVGPLCMYVYGGWPSV